jgi:hypothetical protein
VYLKKEKEGRKEKKERKNSLKRQVRQFLLSRTLLTVGPG